MATTELSMLAVRMPADLAERIQRLADEKNRSVHAEIRCALRGHLALERDRVARDGGSVRPGGVS